MLPLIAVIWCLLWVVVMFGVLRFWIYLGASPQLELHGFRYIIIFNDSPYISEKRKVFTLAHELGHIILGHLSILESFKIYHSNHPNWHFEREANYFAVCLLCPMPILTRLKPESAFSISKFLGLSFQSSEIAFNSYIAYDKYYNIAWHNDIIKLFDLQQYYTYCLDYLCEVSEEIKQKKAKITYSPGSSFEKLEDEWLYPESLGLS